MTLPLTDGEQRLVLALLEYAAARFPRFICNDFEFAEAMPDVAERRSLMQRAAEWNGDPEEFDPTDDFEIAMDWYLAAIMVARLKGEIAAAPVPSPAPRPSQAQEPPKGAHRDE